MTELEQKLLDELQERERREQQLFDEYVSSLEQIKSSYEQELRRVVSSYEKRLKELVEQPVRVVADEQLLELLSGLEKRLSDLERKFEA